MQHRTLDWSVIDFQHDESRAKVSMRLYRAFIACLVRRPDFKDAMSSPNDLLYGVLQHNTYARRSSEHLELKGNTLFISQDYMRSVKAKPK